MYWCPKASTKEEFRDIGAPRPPLKRRSHQGGGADAGDDVGEEEATDLGKLIPSENHGKVYGERQQESQ